MPSNKISSDERARRAAAKDPRQMALPIPEDYKAGLIFPAPELPKLGHAIDMTGLRIGRLRVECRAGSSGKKNKQAVWKCVCDCGNIVPVLGWSLRSGNTRSCGCLSKEYVKERMTTHGLSYEPRFQMWRKTKYRALKDGIPFRMEWTDLPEIPEKCPVLGIPLGGVTSRGGSDNSPSVDRIIPENGYIRGNVRIISKRANVLKNNGTLDELVLVGIDAAQLRAERLGLPPLI